MASPKSPSPAPPTLADVEREHFLSRTGPQRTGLVGWTMVLVPLGLAAVGLAPQAAPILRVDRWEHAAAMVALSAIMAVATLLWHRGPLAVYRVFEVVESLSMLTIYTVLVGRSWGGAVSLFWLYFLAHTVVLGQMGHIVLLHGGAVLGLPAALSLVFGRRGDLTSAALTLVFGIVAEMTYLLLAMSTRRLMQAELERRLASQAEADEERKRLARDLHDGLGAELTSLLWRARRLGDPASGAPDAPDMRELAGRVEQSLESLRELVQGLRREPIAWPLLVEELRQRARQLAGDEASVVVEATSTSDDLRLDGELRLDLSLLVQESVNNAIRHGHARHVRVSLDASREAVHVTIDDDGEGLPPSVREQGGPRSLRERVQTRGGTFVALGEPGASRIEAHLPRR